VHLWETATGKERRRFCYRDFQSDGVAASVQSVRLSPDGKRLAVLIRAGGSSQLHIGVWDTVSGKLLKHRSFPGDAGSVLTPDASGVTVLGHGMLAIEETATGKRLVTFLGVEDLVPIAFSPGGKLVAVVRRGPVSEPFPGIGKPGYVPKGDVTGLSLVDVTTGQEILQLETGEVDDFAFSPDGRVLATSRQGIVCLWEVATGKEIGPRRRYGEVNSVALLPGDRGLLTGLADGTILVWDITPEAPATNEPERLWTDLAAEDARQAYRAVAALAASPARTIAYLKQHLQPVPELDPKRVAQRIADLDSEQFAVRDAATKELAALGERVRPALRRALEGKPSAEVRRRLVGLLATPQRVPTGEVLRELRAIWVLERIGTIEARQLLRKLASGAMAPPTRAAREALERLELGL
jgi:hypothetical protein